MEYLKANQVWNESLDNITKSTMKILPESFK